MTKREKIEYKFEEMMDDIDYKQYHIICNYIDLTVGEALVNQKQSILKAIVEAKPKIEHDDWEHDCDGCSILGERRGIKRFESVIKEVLGGKE